MHHRNRTFQRGILALLVALIVATPVLSVPAEADEISGLEHRADQISTQITALEAQIRADTAAVELANYEAEVIAEKIEKVEAQLEEAQRNEEFNRRALAGYALNAYVNGGDGSVDLPALMEVSGDHLGARQGYQTAAVGNRQDLVDGLQASQRLSSDRREVLAEERAKAEEVAEEAEAKKADAEAAKTELEALRSQVEGRLAELIGERQAAARRALEEQARAEAAQALGTEPATVSISATSLHPGAGGKALAAAETQLGTPYVWGGSSPGGFDCSGLMLWAWGQAGVSLPRVTYSQRYAGQTVPIAEIQPGDLVFYSGFGHVGMYAGGGQIIHAPRTGDVVKYSSLYMSNPLLVVRPG